MTSCVRESGYPGLLCGEQCRWVAFWCRDGGYNTVTCTTFTSNNRDLCQNRTFWEDISCGTYLGSEGFRCKGTNMRCVYPEYSSTYTAQTCDDHSDAIFP